jgi:hypothetical protein
MTDPAVPTDGADPEPTAARSRVRGLLLGLAGGAVATASMSVFREPTARAYPPTAEFWAEFVSGGEPDEHPIPAVVLHLLYGTLAGGAFGATVGAAGDRSSKRPLSAWAVAGAVYGVALSEFGLRVLLRRVNGQELSPDERVLFHLGHLVYGLTLGSWCGYRSGE